MASRFMAGMPLLMGDNKVPGAPMPKELKDLIPTVFKICTEFGLDYYPTVVQMLTYDEVSEIAAYGGFPVRYPHWQWGMEYEELQRGYEYGMHKIYEMVINSNPCYLYCLHSNTLVDNITVIAHALGHNHFFKNNVFFEPTQRFAREYNMINELANHGNRIREYMTRWGKERVTEFIDHILRIDTLVDPAAAWDEKEAREVVVRDTRKYRQPRRLKVDAKRQHMEDWINPRAWKDREQKRIARKEVAEDLGLFDSPVKDIMGFLRNNAPFKPWQADIFSMLYEESLYFSPQGKTKMINEGFASWVDFNIMARMGYVSLGQKHKSAGIIEYADHKMGVLGGHYSLNPYKLGFSILMDIEERWDKGQFGPEWDDCKDMKKKENWDTKAMLGKQKVFEVCNFYDDPMLIAEFFTEDLCRKMEFFTWKHYPNGDTKLETVDYPKIKAKLMRRFMNRGLPDIKLVDPNHRGRGQMLLQDFSESGTLYDSYTREVLTSLRALWGNDVLIASKNKDGSEIVYHCHGQDADKGVTVSSRESYQKA